MSQSHLSLGDRMKMYERECDTVKMNSEGPCVVRLDGNCFSKWTRVFQKPFDPVLHRVFVLTCADLLQRFAEARTVYTQSDEITVLFPEGVQMFGGRAQKVTTVMASYTTARFNFHLSHVPGVPEEAKTGTAAFDARAFDLPNAAELLNNLMWRCKIDCQRNAKAQYAGQYLSAKRVLGMSTPEQVETVKAELGPELDYDALVPAWAKYGTTLKKALTERECENPKTGEKKACLRTEIVSADIPYYKFSDETCAMICNKHITGAGPEWTDV